MNHRISTYLLGRRMLLAGLLCFCTNLSGSVEGQNIEATGQYSPSYNGTDNPWIVGTSLSIAGSQSGNVIVSGGAQLQCSSTYLSGNQPSEGVGVVSGSGSEWLCDHNVFVGDSGKGEFRIEDGGYASFQALFVARNASAEGSMVVSGSDSKIESSFSGYIGQSGSGELVIQQGALADLGSLRVGRYPGSVGLISISGFASRLRTNHLSVGGDLDVAGGVGVLEVSDTGRIDMNGTLTVWPTGLVDLNYGFVEAGTLELLGGVIHFEVRGYGTGESSNLYLEGPATLDGEIVVSLQDYTPAIGDYVQLVYASDYEGNPTFNFCEAALPAGMEWDTAHFLVDGSISVVAADRTFDTGLGRLNGIGFNPMNRRLYVHGEFDNTIEIFDRYGFLMGSIPDPGEAGYASDYFFSETDVMIGNQVIPAGSMLVIEDHNISETRLIATDPDTGAILATQAIDIPNHGQFVGGTYCPETQTFFVVSFSSDIIYEVDGNTGLELNQFPVGGGFDVYYGDIEFNPRDGLLHVVGSSQNTIRQMTTSGEFVRDVPVPAISMTGVGFDPATGAAWVCSLDGNVYRIAESRQATMSAYETTIVNGVVAAGGVEELLASDNEDLSVSRAANSLQPRVIVQLKTETPNFTPCAMEATVEGSVFARGAILQRLQLFDHELQEWVVIDSRDANRFADRTDVISVEGGIAKFLHPETGEVWTRLRYDGGTPRQRFTVNLDQFQWTFSH